MVTAHGGAERLREYGKSASGALAGRIFRYPSYVQASGERKKTNWMGKRRFFYHMDHDGIIRIVGLKINYFLSGGFRQNTGPNDIESLFPPRCNDQLEDFQPCQVQEDSRKSCAVLCRDLQFSLWMGWRWPSPRHLHWNG